MSKIYIPWMIANWICKSCNGTGEGLYNDKTELVGGCPDCDGNGYFSAPITVRELAEAITEFQK